MKNEIVRGKFDFVNLKEKYLNYIDVADKTIKTYDIALRQFAKYMAENDIANPTREDIIAYRDMLKENHSVATVNSYLIALRNFFDFLDYNGLYKNITRKVKGLKDTELHKREALSSEDCKKMYESAQNLREKAMFLLLLSCGLRANELVNIEINDFKEFNGNYRLYVLGKGRDAKTDFVIVPSEVLEIIRKYVAEYEPTDYLFYSVSKNNYRGKISTFSVRRIINDMYERVGLKKDTIVVHSLRHSFATISLQNGQDIRQVSKAMRHRSISVTEKYAHDLESNDNLCSSVVFNSILGGK